MMKNISYWILLLFLYMMIGICICVVTYSGFILGMFLISHSKIVTIICMLILLGYWIDRIINND